MESCQKIGLDTVIGQKKGLAAVDMDGEKVMMNIDKGRYYALNNVGGYIWELAEKPQQVSDMIAALREEYDVDAETCQDNVLAFLSRLHEEGLVCVY